MANTPAVKSNQGTVDKPQQPADIKQFLAAPQIQKRINEMLGKRSSQFTTSVIAMAGQDRMLASSEPRSLFNAALTAASLDLPINKNLGFAHIIPYDNKKAGVVEAQFQMGWKGFVQLAQRSGLYKKLNAIEVHAGQLVEENPVDGNTYDWSNQESDVVVGYLAFFELHNGYRHELYMSKSKVEGHGKKYSQSFKAGFGPWKDNFDAMALKTVIKLLLSKWGPLSIELQKAVEVDQAVIKSDGERDYIDGTDMMADSVKADEDKKRAILEANTDKATGEIHNDNDTQNKTRNA